MILFDVEHWSYFMTREPHFKVQVLRRLSTFGTYNYVPGA